MLIGDHLQMAPILHGEYLADTVAAQSILQMARIRVSLTLNAC